MNSQYNNPRIRKLTLRSVAAAMLGALTLAAVLASVDKPAAAAEITVYKSPACGCCGAWVDHLERNGFEVAVRERLDMQPVKQRLGVPDGLHSCHTAEAGGYLIEGHVPAASIRRLLSERPDLKGLAVPGMPMGSPGMEGPRSDPYNVMGFTAEGGLSVYDNYNQ